MFKTKKALISAALVTALVATIQPAGAQLTPPLYNIHGYTTDAVGRALVGVTVRDRSNSDTTDGDGRFDLPQRELGSIPLTASRWDLDSRMEYVTVNVPEDTRHDFPGLLYRISMSSDTRYFSTTAGSATVTVNVTSWAPSPGSQGELGNSCVTVTDARTGTTTDAALEGQNPNGSYSWRLPISIPQSTLEGSYLVSARAVACDSGMVLTRQVTTSYIVDNTPPSLSNPLPIWGHASPVVSVEASDEGGSRLHLSNRSISIDGVAYPTDFALNPPRVQAHPTGLTDGEHFVEVNVSDNAGNESSLNFTFNVDTTAPTLSDQSPEGTTSDRAPELKIRAAAGESGLDAASIRMTISGPEGLREGELASTFEPSTGWITYQIPEDVQGLVPGEAPLFPGRYSVRVEVANLAGTVSIKEWEFVVVLV